MDQDNMTDHLQVHQKDIDSVSRRRHFIERVGVFALIIFFAASGIVVTGELGVFSTPQLQTSVVQTQQRQAGHNLRAEANPHPGKYSQRDLEDGKLFISLDVSGAGEIRYSVGDDAKTFTASQMLEWPLYPGYGIPLDFSRSASQEIHTVVVDNNLALGELTTFRYTAGPDPVSAVIAEALPNGQVELTWNPVEGAVGYRVIVDDEDVYDARAYTTFIVSGLSLSQHTLAVVAVDARGALSDSEFSTIYVTPQGAGLSTGELIHSAFEESFIAGDMDEDGDIDVDDFDLFLDAIPGGVDAAVLDRVITRFGS